MDCPTIKLSEIKIARRMRGELGDLSGLADSIRRNGLHEPVVLDENNFLLAGERRYRAHEQLGMESIYFVRKSGLTEDQKAELEFEENYWRKKFTWQEEALGILNIYRKKKRAGALGGFSDNWHLVISEMFGMAIGTVNYILVVARKLEQELKLPEYKRRYHNFQSVNEAYRLGILGEREDEENAKLAEQHRKESATQQQEQLEKELVSFVEEVKASPDLLEFERQKYESNPNNKTPFDTYWSEKQQEAEVAKNTIYISNKFVHGDCIAYMNDKENASRFDHIITDPPYAIDMDNLNQQNTHGGLKDLDRVVDAHQVDENISLLDKFFTAAFRCTKENAFVVVCGDCMQWQYMYDLAISAGFAVQRWPIIWQKVNQSVMNNCAGYNTTKDYEIIMLCRKPGATLQKKRNSSIIQASSTEAVKSTGHPFAKPFELTKELVELCSIEGQTILEPFAGGGSMVIQMLRSNRNVVAVEKDERHYSAMIENVKREYYLKLNPRYVFK
jgi:DNA modification methylase